MFLALKNLTPKEWLIFGILAILATTFLVGGAYTVSQGSNDRERDNAISLVRNCEQIELIKDEIRRTVEASLERLPKVAYYKDHPDELAVAIKDTKASIGRFAAKDCYALPSVQDAGVKPPKE